MRARATTVAALSFVAATSVAVAAGGVGSVDPAPPASGPSVRAGLAVGSLAFGGDAGAAGADRETGLTVRLGGGWRLGPGFELGGEVDVWAKESAGATTTVRGTYLVAALRPRGAPRYRFTAGLGRLLLDEPELGNRATGPSAKLTVDRRLARFGRWSLSVYAQGILSRDVEVEQSGSPTGFTEDPSLLLVGVAVGL